MLVVFTGKAGAGKTTAARHLVEKHDFCRRGFSQALKDMMRAGFGLSAEQLSGSERDTPLDVLCGRTPRYAMQTIGTEWGRRLLHDNIWVEAWRSQVLPLIAEGENIVVDDMRFPNENEAILLLGGYRVRIVRAAELRDGRIASGVPAHESEAHELPCDIMITNNGGLPELYEQVDTVVKIL